MRRTLPALHAWPQDPEEALWAGPPSLSTAPPLQCWRGRETIRVFLSYLSTRSLLTLPVSRLLAYPRVEQAALHLFPGDAPLLCDAEAYALPGRDTSSPPLAGLDRYVDGLDIQVEALALAVVAMRDAMSCAARADPPCAAAAAVEMRAQMARVIAAEALDSVDRAGRARPWRAAARERFDASLANATSGATVVMVLCAASPASRSPASRRFARAPKQRAGQRIWHSST